MIVAITGGTGFIGRHLIARHVGFGDRVRYLTRKAVRDDNLDVVSFRGSLSSPVDDLCRFVDGADVLYHCAAELRDEKIMESTNILGTANLLAAASGKIGRWVQLSSTGVYGKSSHGVISEASRVNPDNAYEKSKARSDALVVAAAENLNLPCVLVRPSNVYGTDMPNQSLFQLIKMIDKGLFFFIGKSAAQANYIHVENVIDALILAGGAKLGCNGREYIVSDHRSMRTFVGLIAAALGKQTPRIILPEKMVRAVVTLASCIPRFPLRQSRVDALTNNTVYQSERIANELGYSNRVSMEEGIYELVRYWKNKGC